MPWRTIMRWIGVVAVAVAALLSVIALIWPITDSIAKHDVGLITGPTHAAALQTARETVRTQLLTLGAGLFAAGALVYTARNFRLSRESQVTDRYTKAIEQLGSDKLDVRIGGIYALERVARDSAKDHPTVMEVLTAFVREHSREAWPSPADGPGADVPRRATRPDVQAAVTVIGRRIARYDREQVDLTGANLYGARLTRANLGGARLTDANLGGAHLGGADLRGAVIIRWVRAGAHPSPFEMRVGDLTRANLADADLTRANLHEAALHGADLARACLSGADLTIAHLTDADLTGAYLAVADLTGADLTGADLTSADLTAADLTGAVMGPDAVIPAGWQRDTGSGRLTRADPSPRGTITN